MFDIEYRGGNTVIISTKKAKLVTDPKQSVIGLKDLAQKGVIEVATEERFAVDNPEALLSIESPGEYEVSDFSIRGVAAQRHLDAPTDPMLCTIYRIEVGDVRIALIGNVAPKLDEEQLENLGVVDVVIIPIGGGGYTLDATSAAAMVRQIDARVVVPVHYAGSGLKYEVAQDTLELFAKELGAAVEMTGKLKVKSASSLPAVLTILELERS